MGDIRETVRKASIFKNLEDEEISEVLNIMTEKEFHKRDLIMQEGNEGSTMYMLLEGESGGLQSPHHEIRRRRHTKSRKGLVHG